MNASASRALLSTLRARRRSGSVGARLVAGVAVALGLGALFAPGADGVASGRAWGGWPIETAFGGLVLVAAVVSFSVQELLYRSHDASALRALPLSAAAFGRDRFGVSLGQSAMGGVLVAALIAPSLIGASGGLVVSSLALVVLGSLVVPSIAFASVVISGEEAARAHRAFPGRAASTSAALHLAPGAAFGASVALLLLLKLGVEEPLRLASSDAPLDWLGALGGLVETRSALLALGIPACTALVGAFTGLRRVARSHDDIQAFFVDAETHGTAIGYVPPSRELRVNERIERLAGAEVALLAWKDGTQLARSAPFLRVGTVLVVVGAVFVGWVARAHVTPELAGLVGGGWLALVLSPLRRLSMLGGEQPHGLADQLSDARTRAAARRIAASREALVHTAALVFIGIGLGPSGAVAAASVVVMALVGVVAGTWYAPSTEPFRIGIFAMVSAVALAAAGPVLLIVGTAAVVAVFAAVGFRLSPSHGA